jgi:Fe2+ transport system protein FeoA
MRRFSKMRRSEARPPDTMPDHGLALAGIKSGTCVQIEQMAGGHHFLSRLASLGFTPGARLKVLHNYGHGPLIVSVRDTRVALGRGEAEKILVAKPDEVPNED